MTAVLTGLVVICLGVGALPPPLPVLLGAAAAATLALLGGHSHGGAPAMDRYARRSRLSAWNPSLKAAVCLVLVALCVCARSPLPPLALLAVLSALTVGGGGVSLRRYLSLLSLPAAFLLLSALALLWDYAPTPAGVLHLAFGGGWLVLTAEAQAAARLVLGRALGALGCLYFLSLSTPVPEIVRVLRRWHVPAVVTELAVLIYRYVFLLLAAHRDMRAAAASRLGYGGLCRSLRTTGAVYGNLLAASFRRAGACFDAMESRCYRGELRFLERDAPIRPVQALLLGILAAAMAAAVAYTAR